jgi:hypothetical protein
MWNPVRKVIHLQMVGFPYRTVSFQEVFHVECHVFYSMDMF